MGQLYITVAFALCGAFTSFCIVALIRRYYICYCDYVDDRRFERIPDDIVNAYGSWDVWWNNNSPYTFFHLLQGWLSLMLVAWTWIVSVPAISIIYISTVHRASIRKKKEFESRLKQTNHDKLKKKKTMS